MGSKRDYYEVLGIQRGASPEEIKRAYRQRARETHPDVNREPSAAQAFKEVNEAYEVLNDPQKRAAYDRFGHSAVNGGFGADPFGGFEGFPDMADIFEIFTGGGFRTGRSRQAAPRRGADIGYRLTISFDEAIFGTEKEIEYDRTEI